MPSIHQVSGAQTTYRNEAVRVVATKPKRVVLSIKPMCEENAREWLGAASTHGDSEMVEHFVKEVRQLKQRDP